MTTQLTTLSTSGRLSRAIHWQKKAPRLYGAIITIKNRSLHGGTFTHTFAFRIDGTQSSTSYRVDYLDLPGLPWEAIDDGVPRATLKGSKNVARAYLIAMLERANRPY
jgi:hypothetical protein